MIEGLVMRREASMAQHGSASEQADETLAALLFQIEWLHTELESLEVHLQLQRERNESYLIPPVLLLEPFTALATAAIRDEAGKESRSAPRQAHVLEEGRGTFLRSNSDGAAAAAQMAAKADETDSSKLLLPPSPTRPAAPKQRKVTFQRSLSETRRERQHLPDIDDVIDDVTTAQTALPAPPTTFQSVKSWGLPFQRSQSRRGVSEDSVVGTQPLPSSPPPTPSKWTLPFPYSLSLRRKAVPLETAPPPAAPSADWTAFVKRPKSLNRGRASADMSANEKVERVKARSRSKFSEWYGRTKGLQRSFSLNPARARLLVESAGEGEASVAAEEKGEGGNNKSLVEEAMAVLGLLPGDGRDVSGGREVGRGGESGAEVSHTPRRSRQTWAPSLSSEEVGTNHGNEGRCAEGSALAGDGNAHTGSNVNGTPHKVGRNQAEESDSLIIPKSHPWPPDANGDHPSHTILRTNRSAIDLDEPPTVLPRLTTKATHSHPDTREPSWEPSWEPSLSPQFSFPLSLNGGLRNEREEAPHFVLNGSDAGREEGGEVVRDPVELSRELVERMMSIYRPFSSAEAPEVYGGGGTVELHAVTAVPLEDSHVRQSLSEYRVVCQRLRGVDPAALSHYRRVAFWVNIFNALIMHVYLVSGPPPSSPPARLRLLDQWWYQVGPAHVSALTVEHAILGNTHMNGSVTPIAFREGDPRASWPLKEPETQLAFALTHGGRSSPPVRVYSACRIAEEVRRARGEYLHANARREGELLLVPSLVSGCYAKLGRSEDELLEWIAQSLPPAAGRALWEKIPSDEEARSKIVKIQPFEWRFQFLFLQ